MKKKDKSLHQIRKDISSSIKSWLFERFPFMRCVFKRKMCFHFRNEEEVNTTLEHFKNTYEKLAKTGYTQRPQRGYKCHCGYWHLTHLRSFNPKRPFVPKERTGFFD